MEKRIQTSASMIRIAVTGPESTGKSTLSKELSHAFNAHWVAEYAREYLKHQKGYTAHDLDIIAQRQWELMHPNNIESSLLVSDTEMTVMKIWSEFKYYSVSPFIEELYNKQQFDHYLLCNIDLPWEPDPMREHPNSREELMKAYLNALDKSHRPFTVLSGSHEERMKTARGVVKMLLTSH